MLYEPGNDITKPFIQGGNIWILFQRWGAGKQHSFHEVDKKSHLVLAVSWLRVIDWLVVEEFLCETSVSVVWFHSLVQVAKQQTELLRENERAPKSGPIDHPRSRSSNGTTRKEFWCTYRCCFIVIRTSSNESTFLGEIDILLGNEQPPEIGRLRASISKQATEEGNILIDSIEYFRMRSRLWVQFCNRLIQYYVSMKLEWRK